MKLWLMPALLSFVSLPLLADTLSTMRCGNRLVEEGDHAALVNGICGEPAYVESRTISRYGPTRQRYDNQLYGSHGNITGREIIRPRVSRVQVPVKVWVYNFGSNRFMREVVFLDGKVEYIKSLGYGY